MAAIENPKVTFNIVAAPTPVQNAPQRVLMIGQQGAGTAADGVLVKNIGTSGQEDALFGRKSMLAYMIRAFRQLNVVTQVDAIALDDNGGGVAATGVLDLSGVATTASQLKIVIQSKTNFLFTIPTAVGDTAAGLATNLAAAVNNNDSILVTANAVSDVVTFTCVHAGTFGNTISLRIEQVPDDFTIDALTAFAGGSNDPDTAPIFTQITDIRYQMIVYPGNYPQATVVDFLDSQFNSTNAIRDGIVFLADTDIESNFIADAAALDSLSAVIIANKLISQTLRYEGGMELESDVSIASQAAALRTLRLTPNQNIANLLVGGSVFSTFGGPALAAVPYHNTPLENLPIIEEELGWTKDEQDELNGKGVAFLGNNSNLTSIIMGDMVTTYLTNANAVSDKTFKFLNAVDTSSTIREYFFNNNKQQYAQTVLTQGTPIPNTNMVSVQSIRGFQVKLYEDLSRQPFGLVPNGDQAIQFFNDNLVVSADFESGTVTIISIVPIVSQVRVINGTLRISFTLQTGN